MNGVRSATSKGFVPWLKRSKFDVICLQEIRADLEQIPKEYEGFSYQYWNPATSKKGYSGVAILSKTEPKKVTTKFPNKVVESEGRFIEAEFEDFSVISFYMPNGTASDERYQIKLQVMDDLFKYLKKKTKKNQPFIFCSDVNIAHQEIDLKNWRANQKRSGFLQEERDWITKLVGELNVVDAFRSLYPKKQVYTWWSQRGNARENNVGWRIDYHLLSGSLKNRLKEYKVYRSKFFSDHAPAILDLKE